MLIVNILITLCQGVGSDGAIALFTYIRPWFTVELNRKSLQKKAYRILTELYKRHKDSALEQFFETVQPTVGEILRLESKAIAEPAWASRLAVFRYVSFLKSVY